MLSPTPSDPTALSPGRSSCSSDTGDILIRSTRIVLPDGRQEAAEITQPVQITVQKLRDPQPVQPNQIKEKQRLQKARHKPEVVDPKRAAADSQIGQELQTSCYKGGGRGVVLGALRQRCHITHHKREVSVQLLEPRLPPNTSNHQNTPDLRADAAAGVSGDQTEVSTGCLGDISKTAAAAAAAAVAATAPLIKAQSDIEARMSQLSDGIQKMLHTNREGDSRGQGLSQQTLHHLETLQSQQLQLQSQLLESAIKIVRGHDSVTSDSKAAAKVWDQKPSSSGTGGTAITPAVIQRDAVTMETWHRDFRPEQTRDNLYLQDPVTDPRSHTFHLQSLANQTQEAAGRASDMLQQMECLKTDIKMLLTQKDAPEFTLPAPDCLQIQQNQPESQQSQSKPKQDQVQFHEKQLLLSNSDQSPNNLQQTDSQNTNPQFQSFHIQREESHKNMGRHLQSQHNQPHSQNLRPIQTPSQTGPLLIQDSLCQEVHSQSSQRRQVYSHQSLSSLFQKKPDGPSMLEEASQVLRQARRRKKVLEDNLEALLKAKTGEILHCQLEALAANREVTEGVRIKKTVDAWISALTRDVQDHPRPLHGEMPPVDAIQCRAANATKSQARASGRGKPMTLPKGISNKPGMGRGSRGQIAGHRAQAEPVGVSGNLVGSQQDDVDGELYLTRLYGKLPYEGLRRTLKKSPYPRFSSPASPLGRKPCPRLVESIRGVKLKSCKTQTSLTPFLNLSAGQPSKRNVFDSSHLDLHESDQFTVTCAESSTGATAIPLRLPRMDCPSRREHAQERPSALPAPLSVSEGNMIDRADNQQKQQLVTEKPPSSSSCIIKIIAAESPREKEDEENTFPGNNFLSVTDVHQEDKSDVGEEAVVLEGGPSPPPVQYHSPAFPPEAPSSRCVETVTPVVTRSQPQDILENRLVEWVEQQLMSRIIADMYRPLTSDPAQNDSTDQSELEERSLSSDDVEAVGSGGLQLFVDSSVSVDSALIRQLVNEVLTETVAQILCRTNALNTAPEPEPGLDKPKSEPTEDEEENLAPLVPTPVPTPLASVPQLSRETTPAATPPPSKPSSPVTRECPQPITAPEPVATPTATPEPPLPEESPSAAHQTPPPPICGNPELPLDEERSVEQLESQKQHLVVSVEEEELPVCRPVPAPAQSQPSLTDPSPALSPRLSETCSSSSSKSSSSSTVTAETEAALKHISEGELLISINQLAPLTEEEGVCSFSSSLQEVEDMAFDSSAVEHVGGRNLLLTLLTKMELGATHGRQRPQPEGSWGREEMEDEVSVGEVRDYGHTKPQNQTTNPGQWDQTSACGQISQPADVGQRDKQNTQGGARKTDVYLPTFRTQEDRSKEDNEEIGGSVNADTDSSTNDVF